MSTLFTRDSRKLWLALSAMSVLGLLYVCIVAALTALSTWAERDLHSFPFKEEDWLRYLLPPRVYPQPRPRILLGGPSTVRENVRYERFETAFPQFTIDQGGISLGTIGDVTASLEYVKNVYGVGALPDVMILGISPRFIADIPDVRPFSPGIDRYSPYFSTHEESSGIALIPKTPFASLVARARFLASKEPERFRTAFLALAYHWISDRMNAGKGSPSGAANQVARSSGIDRFLQSPPVARLLRGFGLGSVVDHTVQDLLAWRISPYKYSLNPPYKYGPSADLRKGWWKDVYTWNPAQEEKDTMRRLKRFVDFADACGIEVWVVNFPERDVSRAQFDQANYDSYVRLIKKAFGDRRYLDLREFLTTDEFYDREHSVVSGSVRLTDALIEAIGPSLPDPRARSAGNRSCR